MKTIISGGRVIDPANGRDGEYDLLIEDGKIAGVEKPGSFSSVKDAEMISAKGQLVTPGLVDIHVHLRDPGQEWKETIDTGRRAAEVGGFTTICCMPNTKPLNDTPSVTRYILSKAAERPGARVYPIGCISKELKSEVMAPMLELTEAGCVAFSDDGRPVTDPNLMRRALEYALQFNGILTVHEEDLSLSRGFSMHEGIVSVRLGLKGAPDAAENVTIARDIELARLTGGRVHFCHVTTARGAKLIERAKEDGIPVTGEVTPHHFTLTHEAVEGYNTNAKMSPPLRTAEDIEALLQALENGVIDCIATDHAPHEYDSKHRDFPSASFGILGFQTAVPLTLKRVKEGKLSLVRAIEALTVAPARCFNLSAGTLSKGAKADVTVIDPERVVKHTREFIASKSKNTPWLDQDLTGHATMTLVDGRVVFSLDQYLEGLN
jgi:dihydroorotase